MKKVILGVLIGAVIIGIILSVSNFLIENQNTGREPTPTSQDKINEESVPQGRHLSIEFDEKMGLSAP